MKNYNYSFHVIVLLSGSCKAVDGSVKSVKFDKIFLSFKFVATRCVKEVHNSSERNCSK